MQLLHVKPLLYSTSLHGSLSTGHWYNELKLALMLGTSSTCRVSTEVRQNDRQWCRHCLQAACGCCIKFDLSKVHKSNKFIRNMF